MVHAPFAWEIVRRAAISRGPSLNSIWPNSLYWDWRLLYWYSFFSRSLPFSLLSWGDLMRRSWKWKSRIQTWGCGQASSEWAYHQTPTPSNEKTRPARPSLPPRCSSQLCCYIVLAVRLAARGKEQKGPPITVRKFSLTCQRHKHVPNHDCPAGYSLIFKTTYDSVYINCPESAIRYKDRR